MYAACTSPDRGLSARPERGTFIMRSILLLIFASISALGGIGIALAHAVPKTEPPPVGATVTTASGVLLVAFAESIEPHFGGLVVENAPGQRVANGGNNPDPDNAARLSTKLKRPLAAGTYTMIWHVLSADGHRTHSGYSFSVARRGCRRRSSRAVSRGD
jgi:methionine-rich copper-binding protein CopC